MSTKLTVVCGMPVLVAGLSICVVYITDVFPSFPRKYKQLAKLKVVPE